MKGFTAMIEMLESLLAPVAISQGCELYDIEYVKEGRDRILRLYIDKEEGIDLDDCERVSRAVEIVLDEHDLISGEYRLQVSSPGVERKITKLSHFLKYIGHKVSIRLFAPQDPETGRKKFTGIITEINNTEVTIRTTEEDQIFIFALTQISACRLIVFD